jgi:WD40 repeat protein
MNVDVALKPWTTMNTLFEQSARVLTACLLLVACGGGDESSTSSTAPAAGTPVPAAIESPRVAAGKLPRNRALRGITAMDVAPDGGVAAAGADGRLELQDDAGNARAIAGSGGVATTAVAFSADGKLLVSVGRDSIARIWSVATRTRVLSLQGHEHPIRAVAMSSDGAWAASAGEETRVMVWNAATGKLAKVLGGHASFVNAVAFSPDGRILATGDAAGHLTLWNVTNGVPRQRLASAHADEVNAVAFSPDGRVLATAGEDGRVVLWSADSGQKLLALTGHQSGVRTLAFSRDGQWLASAGSESKVLVWDMGTRTLARSIDSPAGVNALVFDIRKRKDVLLVGDEGGRVSRWDVARGQAR